MPADPPSSSCGSRVGADNFRRLERAQQIIAKNPAELTKSDRTLLAALEGDPGACAVLALSYGMIRLYCAANGVAIYTLIRCPSIELIKSRGTTHDHQTNS